MHTTPILHSYQQRPLRPAATAKKPATLAPDTTMHDAALSPHAQLHRAIIEKKQQQQQQQAFELETPKAAASPVAAFSPTMSAFPMLTSPVHTCGVHASLPLLHPSARPLPVSSSSALPRASFWNLRCGCLFSAVPDEVLLFNVFTFLAAPELCTLASVCTRWKFLSTDPILWREVDLSKHAKVLSEEVLDTVLQRTGSELRTLKLCNLKTLGAESLQRVGEVHLAANSNLQSLHFCSVRAVDFTVLSSLLAGSIAATLRELSLFGCVNVDDACVRLIRRQCVRLADLSLRGCLKITDAAFALDQDDDAPKSPQSPTIELLLESELETEMLSRSSSFDSVASSSSAFSGSSSELGRFAHLTALNIANCRLITDVGLSSIARGSPLLQSLNAHGLTPTDAMVDEVTACCPSLHTLHLSSANPFGGNLHLTDAAIEFIAARLPNIQCLNLSGSSRLTDACIAPLIARCRQLSKLNLGGCFKLTDAGVMALASAEFSSQLTHVSLFQCVHLTDASLQHLADHLPLLQHLDIHSCASLTDATLTHLLQLQTGPLLRDDHDEQEEDGSLMAPPSPRPSAVRSTAFYRLPQLQSLDIGSCRKILPDTVARMRTTRPGVLVTHY